MIEYTEQEIADIEREYYERMRKEIEDTVINVKDVYYCRLDNVVEKEYRN